MLVWLTLPFNDFCGFRSVAVNTEYKLQFFIFIHLSLEMLTDVGIGFQTRENSYNTH